MRHALALLAASPLGACGPAGPPAEEPTNEEPTPSSARADSAEGRQRDHGGMGNHGGMGMGNHGGMGHGMRHGGHAGTSAMGHGHRAPAPAQRDDFHALLDAHESIEREVELTADGAVTRTTTEDPELVSVLRRHAREMEAHVAGGGRVHPWDPLFAALAEHADEIELDVEDIPGGVEATSRGTTPEAIALIQVHAEVVSAFVANGHEEAHREHPVP